MSHRRALLLTGGPDYHNQPFHIAELAGIFAGEGGYDLRITDDLGVLTPESLADYDLIINWSTFLQPSADQVNALIGAVEGGTGFFAIHGGSATFWNSAPYLRFLGSRFVKHDPYKAFLVEIDDTAHPITAGVPNFLVEDELYEQGGDVDAFEAFAAAVTEKEPYGGSVAELGVGPLGPDIHLLASAEGHPLLYTRTWGSGRVHYNALGHDDKALTNPNVRRLLLQGAAWTIGADA